MQYFFLDFFLLSFCCFLLFLFPLFLMLSGGDVRPLALVVIGRGQITTPYILVIPSEGDYCFIGRIFSSLCYIFFHHYKSIHTTPFKIFATLHSFLSFCYFPFLCLSCFHLFYCIYLYFSLSLPSIKSFSNVHSLDDHFSLILYVASLKTQWMLQLILYQSTLIDSTLNKPIVQLYSTLTDTTNTGRPSWILQI